LNAAIESLSPRERHIFTARYLMENPPKLEALAAEYGISRERIRQIEFRAFQKVQAACTGAGTCQRAVGRCDPAAPSRIRNGPAVRDRWTSEVRASSSKSRPFLAPSVSLSRC